MAAPKRGLGGGLNILMGNNSSKPTNNQQEKGNITHLPVAKLIPSSGQPRQYFDEDSLNELSESIKSQGVIQPLIVRHVDGGNFEIIAGERRWRAAKMANLVQVPVVVRDMSDEEAMAVSLIENLQRENLNPLEEAQAIASLRDRLKLNQEEIATKIGKSRSAVANSLRLLQLPDEILSKISDCTITPGHARALLSISNEDAQMLLFKKIMEMSLSVRQSEEAANQFKDTGKFPDFIESTAKKNDDKSSETEKHRLSRPGKSADIKAAQLLLRDAGLLNATISGTKETGRITIPYDSAQKFKQLLTLFCSIK